MKFLAISALLFATVLAPVSAQSLAPNAVFRIFNVTFGTGASLRISDTETDLYIDEAAATSASLGSNAVNIEDACTTALHPCHSNADCTDINGTLGIVQCRCNTGYDQVTTTTTNLVNTTAVIVEGTDCADVDECASGNATICGSGTDQCLNSVGSYSCNCTSGYTYNSANQLCEDINECANATLNDCHANATCTNNVGNFSCACDAGFDGDGVNCTEIDECSTRSITCGNNGTCSDPIGATYSCICDTGFSENTTVDPRECQDIDECSDGSSGCASTADCSNTMGSFTCTCRSGYTGSGTSCSDIDECTTSSPCDANATCTNNNGGFDCACNAGFSGNGTTCQAATLNFCYRLSVTFENATSGSVSSRTSDADTAVSGFLSELDSSNSTDFSYANATHTLEAVLGNTTITELIIEVCLNESSKTAAELTEILRTFTFATTEVGGFLISVLEYDECLTNYGNCSSDANCTNTHGDFTCTCLETHADRSTSGVNGTVCELPTSFTCSSDTVNVTGYLPYFTNLGISNSELSLGTCSGSVSGDDVSFIGGCGATVESNSTHLSYKWNLTNVNESATITIGTFVTIPITCTFDRSQNVSINVTAERKDIVFDDDLNNLPGEAYSFSADAFTNEAVTNSLTGAVPTDTKIYFQLGTSNTLPTDVKIQCTSFSTTAADGTSTSIDLFDGSGCPATRTSLNGPILDTLVIVRNGVGSTAVIGVDSHFYGRSRVTMATFGLTACIGNCTFSCGSSRRRRSIVSARVKREVEQTGVAQVAFERSPDDACSRDCGEGVCVFDRARTQQCVCGDGTFKRSDGTCTKLSVTDDEDKEEDKTIMILLIVLGCVLALLVGILIFTLFYRKKSQNQKEYELDYVNTHAIGS